MMGGGFRALALVAALFGAGVGVRAQDLYDESTLRTIELTIPDANWFATLSNAWPGKTWFKADLKVDDVVYRDVGVRFRGNSSYRAAQKKKPLKISMDAFKPGQRLLGYRTLNLNNGAYDPSHVREVLTFRIFRQYMAAPKANFVKVVINGQNHGIYINVQQINKDFGREWFGDDDGNRYRAEPATVQLRNDGSLIWLGSNPGAYATGYELKSENTPAPWTDLVDLCDAVANAPIASLESTLPPKLSVDGATWMLALNLALSNPDDYRNYVGHNYYLYHDDADDRFRLVSWDVNHAFASRVPGLYTYDPDSQITNPFRPLLSRMLAVPRWRERYLHCIRTVTDDWIDWARIEPWVTRYRALIDAEMQKDPVAIYPYTWFRQSVAQDVGGFAGLEPFVRKRRAWLLADARIAKPRPTITAVTATPSAPTASDDVWVTARVTAATTLASVTLLHRVSGTFTRTPMRDDGQHRDGEPGDGVYGGRIPPQAAGTTVDFAVEARLPANAGDGLAVDPAAPEIAPHRFSVATRTSDVRIHEFLAVNATGIRDEANEREDWIELSNLGASPAAVGGLWLSDDPLDPTKWRIPPGTTIPSGGTLLVWADDEPGDGPMHATFKLSGSAGEWITLTAADGVTRLDAVSFGPQRADVSLGTHPEWPDVWATFPTPTPREPNAPPAGSAFAFDALDPAATPLALDAAPIAPARWRISVAGAGPGSAGVLVIATTPVHAPLASGPVALVLPYGAVGVSLVADATGRASIDLGAPTPPFGVSVYLQAIAQRGATPTIDASNGVHVRLGP